MVKKFFIVILVLLVLFITALLVLPIVFKSQINDLVKEQINKELKVSVDYCHYDLTIISSFPDFKFSLNELVVIGQGKFEGDTLAKVKEVSLNLNAKKIFVENELQIHSIFIDSLNLKAYILSDSTSSLDVLKDKPETETTQIDTSSESLINMQFESLIVKNSNILYKDDLTNKFILIKDINIDAGADYKNEKATIDGNTQIAELVFISGSSDLELSLKDLDLDIGLGLRYQF